MERNLSLMNNRKRDGILATAFQSNPQLLTESETVHSFEEEGEDCATIRCGT